MFNKSPILLFSIFLAVVTTRLSAQDISLEYDPPAGTVYYTEYDIQSNIDQTIMGIDQNVKAKSYMVLRSEVIERTGETTILDLQYKRLAIETSTAFFSFVLDSESEEADNPVNTSLKALIGKTFRIVLDRKGKIISIEGMEDIFDDVIMESSFNDQAMEQYSKLLTESFGSDNFMQVFGQVSPYLPGKSIKPGDTWEYDSELTASGFGFHVSTLAEFQGYTRNGARLLMKSELSTSGIDGNINVDQAEMKLSGTQAGEIIVNTDTGIPVSAHINQSVEGQISLKLTDTGSDEMTIPVKINSSIHMKTEFRDD